MYLSKSVLFFSSQVFGFQCLFPVMLVTEVTLYQLLLVPVCELEAELKVVMVTLLMLDSADLAHI